jgi:hypothetical protein
MRGLIKKLRREANELIREGGSSEKSYALGMLRVLNSLPKHNKTPWFHKAEKVLHKGYWYAKIKDIPLGDV